MSVPKSNTPKAVVFGCSGPELSEAERRFFGDAGPLGFILFQRNCQNPDQVRGLIADLRSCLQRPDAPVLIDQEGGRVARLKPPNWPVHPPVPVFARLGRTDIEKAVEAARLNARLIAAQLDGLGITVNCAPVLDVPQPGSGPVIAERAAGHTPELAAMLGQASCEGFLDGGILPVIKHIPGLGRAKVDSHMELPVVEARLDELKAVDFAPFKALKHMPWAMTAHVVYKALDDREPATASSKVIERTIRGTIGFNGLLISDDLSMKALSGSLEERARAALKAGCDVALHCNGQMAEMVSVARGCAAMSGLSWRRFERGLAMARKPDEIDAGAARQRLDGLLEKAAP